MENTEQAAPGRANNAKNGPRKFLVVILVVLGVIAVWNKIDF